MMGTPIQEVCKGEEHNKTYCLKDKYGVTRLVDKTFLGQPVLEYIKPNVGKENPSVRPDTTDEFEAKELGLQWQWQANPCKEWYSLEERKGWLRLYVDNGRGGNHSTLYELPNVLTQMFPGAGFEVTAKVELEVRQVEDACGLILTGESYNYITLVRHSEGYFLEYRQGYSTDTGSKENRVQSVKIEAKEVYL